VYVVTLTCLDAEDAASSASIAVTVDVDHHDSFSSSSSSRSGGVSASRDCGTSAGRRGSEAEFFVVENMFNVTLGPLRCGRPVFCRDDKRCSLTVIGEPRQRAFTGE